MEGRQVGCGQKIVLRAFSQPAPMSVLDIKPADQCRYDMIALEIMLRMDPVMGGAHGAPVRCVGGRRRIQCGSRITPLFGLKTSVVTAYGQRSGPFGGGFHHAGGVDVDYIQWRDYDGIGRTVRNGLNLTSADLAFAARKACPTVATQPPARSSRV